eukprot:Gb_26699 [translate_table: standard]
MDWIHRPLMDWLGIQKNSRVYSFRIIQEVPIVDMPHILHQNVQQKPWT